MEYLRERKASDSEVASLSERWFNVFMQTIKTHENSLALRTAADSQALRIWTEALTSVVVRTFGTMGWRGAARGHKSSLPPVPRAEYLALDAVAFESAGDHRWRFPVGVFELENSPADDFVAYALWKVLCVRANLRVVFCYRSGANQGADLVRHLTDEVIQAMEIQTRVGLIGETLVIVGSRNESATFPYGFFKPWTLNANTARFHRN